MIAPAKLPVQYVCDLQLFRWIDIRWALARGVMSPGDVNAFALGRVNDTSCEQEFRLAGLDPGDERRVELVLEKLALAEADQTADSAQRWVFALLLYHFETAANAEEMLEAVEEIYCHYDHPDEMYGFVPWLPPQDGYDPTAHSAEENRRPRTALRFKVRAPEYRAPLHPTCDGG